MSNETVQCNCPDYTEYIQSILDNQKNEIEELKYQNEILLESNNGLALMCNYQFSLIGIIVIFCVVVAAWRILSKWFFGGV